MTPRECPARTSFGPLSGPSLGHGQFWPGYSLTGHGGGGEYVPYCPVCRAHWRDHRDGDRLPYRIFRRGGGPGAHAGVRRHHSLSQHSAGAGAHQCVWDGQVSDHLNFGHSVHPLLCPGGAGGGGQGAESELCGLGPAHGGPATCGLSSGISSPNTVQVLLPIVAIGFNNAVLAEASMSYLGVGVQPPDASLGANAVGGPDLSGPGALVCPVCGPGHCTDDSGAEPADGRAPAAPEKLRGRDGHVRHSRPPHSLPQRAGRAGGGEGNLLHMDEGEILGLVGESGSGKTVTAMALAGC